MLHGAYYLKDRDTRPKVRYKDLRLAAVSQDNEKTHGDMHEVANVGGCNKFEVVHGDRHHVCLASNAPHHTALSDQPQPSPYILHRAHYLKDRGTRPKVRQRT